MWSDRRKAVRKYDRTNVISCYKKLLADRTRVKIYILSAVIYGVYVAGPDMVIASEDYLGVRRKGNPPCNAEDNLHAGLLVIEARLRGY